MVKRVSVAWLPIALAVLLVAYWAGQQNPRRQARATEPTTEKVEPKAPVEGAKPDSETPATTAGTSAKPASDATAAPGAATPWREEPPSAYRPTDTSTGLGPADETMGPGMTREGALAGGTRPGGRDDETDPGWDDGTDKTMTTQPRDSTTGYDTTTAGTTPDYGADATTGRDRADTTTTEVTRELAYTFHLFDGFERDNHWAVESAADHADLELAAEQASEGQRSLKAAFRAFGKGNFELRREVKLDLSDATTVLVDVYNEVGPLDLVLGCRAGYDTTLFTTPPKPLVQGWNKGVSFRLSELSSGDASAFGTSWTWSRDSVSRVSLIFRERDQKEGTVHVDNLRFDRPAGELGHKAKPELKKIVASGTAIERFEPLELAVEFEADYQKFFDRTEVDVLASFFSPSGKRLDVHGFVHDTDGETARPAWKVRFTPNEVGVWRYDVTVKSAGGDTPSGTYAFTCHRKADRRGFIRRSKLDPRYFELDDGSFYYPFGQNVCWASDYDHFLTKIQGYGGNYVRVWLCPWNLQLEDPREPGKYDLRVANALDKLLALCERRGIYVQLALRYHGMHNGDWAKSPYNTANGGPCTSPGQFFTDTAARDQHKQFLDYVVARWGHSPAVFAWELWNEADLARADRDSDLVAWHKEMSDHLKKIDVYRHLVTTSVAGAARCPELFKLPNIDFVPVHFYNRDVLTQIKDSYVRYRELGKPIFIGEFSGGHKPSDDLSDPKGVRIHAGLWMAFVTPLAGSAMPWWWDTYIDKNDLYGHWAALAKFAKGVDRRGKQFEVVRSKIRLGEDAWASMQGLVSPSEAFLWIYDEARILSPEHAGRPLVIADRPVKLGGMLGGRFRVEIWDTHEGKVLGKPTTADTTDGVLTFTLPKCDRDIAVKIVKEGEPRPRLEW